MEPLDPHGIDAPSIAYATRFFTKNSVVGADILIPAHRPGHWYAVVISPRQGIIFIIDHYYRKENYDGLYTFLIKWYTQLLGRFSMDVPSFRKVLHRDLVPSSMNQTDGSSCGIFQCMDFCYLMQTGKLPSKSDFTNLDAPMLRRYMQFCILSVKQNVPLLQDYANQVTNQHQVMDLSEDDKDLRLAMIASAEDYANRERKKFEDFDFDNLHDLPAEEIINLLASIEDNDR